MSLPAASPEKLGWPWADNAVPATAPLPNYPKISIVTPTFNHGQYLEETMRSVLLQDYPNLEYVVIDGGSKDETAEVLKRYEKYLSYWVSEPDNGHAHALNKGFARSTGDILAWINAGDFYFPKALDRVARVFQSFPEIAWLTSSQPGRHQPDIGAHTYFMPGFSRSFFRVGGYLGFEPFSLGFIQQESTFWRKSLWQQAGGYLDESLSMANDFDLWRRFFSYVKLTILDAPLGCFRVHEEQRSAVKAELYKKEAWKTLERAGNSGLSLAFRVHQKLRLHTLGDWRAWLKPVYGEKMQLISIDNSGNLICKWQKWV